MVDVRRVPAGSVRDLRSSVLRPGGPPLVLPGDDETDTAHLAAYDGEMVVGVATVRPADPPFPVLGPARPWQLRGMATDPGRRNAGIGAAVLAAVLRHVDGHGGDLLWCNARVGARSLYERAGLAVRGAPWVDPVLGPHVVMSRAVGRP